MVVNESNNGPGNQPSTLDSCQQKSVGVDKLFSGSQFLNQRGDGWPEHPETGRNQRVHQIQFPNFYFARERQDRNHQDDDRTKGIQHHYQPAPVFAVNQHPREGKHQHCGKGLQHGEGAQRHFGVGSLQDVPGHGGGIHPAAQH